MLNFTNQKYKCIKKHVVIAKKNYNVVNDNGMSDNSYL